MRIAAISVKQPWAHLIATGHKPIEFRAAPRHYRGPVLIHATRLLGVRDWPAGIERDRQFYPTGVALCIVRMVGCEYLPDRDCFGWFLEAPTPIEPFPMRGNLHIFSTTLPRRIYDALPRALQIAIVQAQRRLPRLRAVGESAGDAKA